MPIQPIHHSDTLNQPPQKNQHFLFSSIAPTTSSLHFQNHQKHHPITSGQHQIQPRSSTQKNHQLPKVTFEVEFPIYQEYKSIDLTKKTLNKRIYRHKANVLSNSLSQSFRRRSLIEKGPKHSLYQEAYLEETESKEPQIEEQDWRKSILKYIQLKEQKLLKISSQKGMEGYPLMKLSKNNQILRKTKTKLAFAVKPQIVQDLQKEELFNKKSNTTKKPLSQLISGKKLRKARLFDQIQPSKSQFPDDCRLKSPKQLSGQKQQGHLSFKEIMKRANKGEKILINFIKNYFKQKISPSRRYSYQTKHPSFENPEQIQLATRVEVQYSSQGKISLTKT